ncbi:MAG: cellobiose phosphorylase [Roseburia sp.]|nr:cellobiose phosphorylase [Roseburia sp.]
MNAYYLKKAKDNMPDCAGGTRYSDDIVELIADERAHLGVGVKPLGKNRESFVTGDRFVLDFGEHCVGILSFQLTHVQSYLDAPVCLRLKFGEIPYEIDTDFKNHRGELISSWLSEEIIYVDFPGKVTLPRRYAFRYLEVEILKTRQPVKLTDFAVHKSTSADERKMQPLPAGTDPLLVSIDSVAAKTLAECMQEVYEDGPKRDHRLWIGDLRLQALTDSCLFQNHKLVKHCLYLFAACQKDGQYLPGCLYDKPELFYDEGMGITDYALLYAVTLCDYYTYSKDMETTLDLYPVAKKQVELAASLHDEKGIITFLDGWSSFIDWAEGLKTTTAVEGVYLYTLEKMAELAEAIGKKEDAGEYRAALQKTRECAYKNLFDPQKNTFCNVYDNNQYSVQAQVWMILGGVVEGEEAWTILTQCLSNDDYIQPVTPYMHHYVVEAMIRIGRMEEALDYIKNYWGGMVQAGADTFWEVYVPGNPTLTPYGNLLLHSWCHAWSCSPAYFIRTYFVTVQNSPMH